MITTKEINLKFNKGIAVVSLCIPYLVKTITIKGMSIATPSFIAMVIKAPNLLPNSDDIVYVVRQDFAINRIKTNITHTFPTGSKSIYGQYTFQLFDLSNTNVISDYSSIYPTILIMEFSE